MSDDISMSDYMAIQNAALDASINRNAMRIAANQRNQQQKSNPVVAYIEKDKTPIVRNGFVYANAYLRHRADNPNCFVRQGRQVKVMEFEDRSAYNAFAEKLEEELSRHWNCGFYLCPECFPHAYDSWQTNNQKQKVEDIRNGGIYCEELSIREGFYMIRENDVIEPQFVLKNFSKIRLFHEAGCGCGSNRRRTLIGPYDDIEDAFKQVDMFKSHDGVAYFPCPKCFEKQVYGKESDFSTIGAALKTEIALLDLSR